MLKPLPPLLFAAVALAMTLLDRFAPGATLLEGDARFIGAGLAAIGFALGAWGVLTCRAARTGILPEPGTTTALVTKGPYRFTRNPMYLGMALVLAGYALLRGTLTPWLGVPAFMALVHWFWIRREEWWLAEAFGEAYNAYKDEVRAWV